MKVLSITTLRSMVVSAVLVAMGIVVPIGFHAVGLGSKFMPMILVMMLNGFLLPWHWAVLTGAIVPIASCLLTGMPPLYPPFFLSMSVEMALLSAMVSFLFRLAAPRIWPAVIGGVIFNRLTSLVLTYYLAGWFGLPSKLISLANFAQGLPGIALQLIVLPLIVKTFQKRKGLLFSNGQRPEAPIFQ
jgi:hypothetical protein